MGIYDYTVKDAKGNDVSLKDYEGKVLLIVNTATGCGFTPQYTGLQELYKKYQAEGLEKRYLLHRPIRRHLQAVCQN